MRDSLPAWAIPLEVGSNTVTLLDSNQAVLGSLTSLGASPAAGSLQSANGVLVDHGNNLVGFGTLETPNDLTKLGMINGAVAGNSVGERITLTGYVKGVGTLDDVTVAGTYSPGISPAEVIHGSADSRRSKLSVRMRHCRCVAPSVANPKAAGSRSDGSHYLSERQERRPSSDDSCPIRPIQERIPC